MKKSFWLQLLNYFLVALLTGVLTAAGILFMMPESVGKVSKLEQLQALIEERFIGEADMTEAEDAAARAMIEALGDRWSYYISAEEYQSYYEQQQNAYVGIGVTVSTEDTSAGMEILQITAGGPAEKAGLLAGDVIIGVDGQSILGMNANDTSAMIKGEEGTQVVLTVRRGEQSLQITVKRERIKTPVATATLLEDGIGLIKIANFNTNCYNETAAAIRQLKEEGATKLIFDVRFNGGGYASELVKVLDDLLPEVELFHTVDYKGNESIDMSDAEFLDMPMAVLVNGSSYSAAEFFAAALQEYDAAVVVGEKTTGKGYFQTVIRLNDGSAVGLSVGKYFTPSGISLEGIGITPDKIVTVDDETAAGIYSGTIDPKDDNQLQAAIAALKEK
jgi:carboxyl-terminal processing protease